MPPRLMIDITPEDRALINTTLKTPGPYVDVIAEAQRKVTADIYEIRKQFRQRGIKVYEEVTDDDGVVALYKCRGYESEMRLRWSSMAPQASVVMRKYLGLNEGTRPFVTVPPK